MASKVRGQIAVLPDVRCKLCDNDDVAWKCLVCDELMCDHCKKSHLRSKVAHNHKVVSLEGVEIKPSREKKCQHHPSEDTERYCESCQVPVCIICIAEGNHRDHKLPKINQLLEIKGRELTQMIAESKQKLSTFTETIKSVKKNETDFSSQISQCIPEVKVRNSELKNKLDRIADELIQQLQEIEKKYQDHMKKTVKLIDEDLASLKIFIENCEDKLMKQEIEMIQFVTQVKKRLDKFKLYDSSGPLKSPNFVTRDVDIKEVKAMFGNLNLPSENVFEAKQTTEYSDPKQTTDVQVISTLTLNDKDIISVTSNDQVWMGMCTKKGVALVTINGETLKTINTDFDVYDMAVTKSDELLATVYSGNKVKKLMPNNLFVDLYEASKGYKTRGITVTDNNNIVVCLSNDKKKQSKLVQLSLNGRLINTTQYHKDSKTPLFDDPWDVCSNRNCDLIVGQSNNSIVVLDKTGYRRFTYTGQVKGLTDSLDAYYIVTDKYGHILISDYSNSVIHLLDKDGNFIQFILTGEHGLQNPLGLSIDTLGRLWICSCGNDKCMVVKYI